MEIKTVFWLLTAVLLSVPDSAVAKLEYFMLGGELTLELRPPHSSAITNILWKHGGDLLAEWVQNAVNLTYYGRFDGRTRLDIVTGRLELTGMTEAEVGEYTVEINSNVQSERYNAKAIAAVPKPVVWIQPLACKAGKGNCSLICDGNTAKAEPVTYSWRMGGGGWTEKQKIVNITSAGTKNVETFTCRITNPVSSKDSDAIDNPLFSPDLPENSSSGVGVGVTVGLLLLLLVLGVVAYLKRKVIMEKIGARNNTATAPANGTPANEKTSESVPLRDGDNPNPPPSNAAENV